MSTFGNDWSHRNSFCFVIRHLEIFKVAYFRNKDKTHTIRGEVSKLLAVSEVIVLECSMLLKPEPSSRHSRASSLQPSTSVAPSYASKRWCYQSSTFVQGSFSGLLQ